MKPILEIKNISKKFMINHERKPYLSLREQITDVFKPKAPKEEFWALTDVTFDVFQGDSVGIIGKNGAGKSTLLKILSKITPPTTGEITSRGRIASLLEVGTGFHPELTGRENIFMNGSILGMRKKEIQKNFDAIVDFAGVDKFIDTPLKHYSSGMQLRLAFAVAAFLENEILIIDEVLAVGDAEFQKKCMGKMNEVSKSGRTILFVSHNMNAIEHLCNSGVLLVKGSVVNHSNNIREIINSYYSSESSGMSSNFWESAENTLINRIHSLEYVGLYNNNVKLSGHIKNNTDITLKIAGEIMELHPSWNIGFIVKNEHHEIVFWSRFTDEPIEKWPKFNLGSFSLSVTIPKHTLNEGVYYIEIFSELRNMEYFIVPGKNSPVLTFEIRGGLSDSPYWTSRREGIIAPILNWEYAPSKS